ncbi:MAG TPA: SAM-dependent chlorinase/fluorinase [Thermotogota bacterium]|nr:SAM-dependent chlorinase/fluorinase [Thermotogota bacterium]
MLKRSVLVTLFLVVAFMAFASVTGTITEVDKYGNVHTGILSETFEAAGFELGDVLLVTLGDTSEEMPFVTTYGDVDTGEPLVRLSSGHVMMALNYANFAKTYALEVGSEVTYAMSEKGAYAEELEIRHLVRTEVREDYASDAIFANFREVTIGDITPGRLYRSSHPSIDDPRAPYSIQLVEAAGINTVVNLSDSDEELSANCAFSPFYAFVKENGNMINLNMGVDLLSDEFAAKLKKGLLFIIEKDGPYLVHCVEGKDRAGMTVAILGALMGGTTEEIYADYAKSYENYYHVEKGTPAYDAVINIIENIFISINNEQPVTDDNIGYVAMKYLIEKAGMSYPEVEALEEKLQ